MAKTLAKQFMTRFEDATKPFQHALSTRVECQSIAHVVQVMTDRDPNCTVLSIDGVGAFDLVQEGHDDSSAHHGSGEKLIPFAKARDKRKTQETMDTVCGDEAGQKFGKFKDIFKRAAQNWPKFRVG